MPTNWAARGLHEVARMALPMTVRLKNSQRATTTRAVTPSTHKLCGCNEAPPTLIGA